MAREGYLIIDSDLHMNEPDDLWANYLDAPYRANPPKFFGGRQQALTQSAEDKGNADRIRGMEVQGLAIPAFAKAEGASASSRELRRRTTCTTPVRSNGSRRSRRSQSLTTSTGATARRPNTTGCATKWSGLAR